MISLVHAPQPTRLVARASQCYMLLWQDPWPVPGSRLRSSKVRTRGGTGFAVIVDVKHGNADRVVRLSLPCWRSYSLSTRTTLLGLLAKGQGAFLASLHPLRPSGRPLMSFLPSGRRPREVVRRRVNRCFLFCLDTGSF